MSDITSTINAHLAAYCEPDPTKRASLVNSIWAETSALIDPPFDGTGRDGIAAMTDIVLQHYPGHSFRRTSNIDTHHQFGRYDWVLENADGIVATSGTDFIETNADGQLVRIVGFFGPLSPTTH